MIRRCARLAACSLMLNASWAPLAVAQVSAAPPPAPPPGAQAAPPGDQTVPAYTAEQLDALLAPIALYPDDLLTQVLMATSFPLQVVDAARWVEDPAHKSLTGAALEAALQPMTWDPSVKSLVPFPEVLALLNSNLDWMQQLGYAFSYQQPDVFASVQRLRKQAQVAGNLKSSPQQVVSTEQDAIVIAPAQPNVVYVPTYNPTVVYGTWPYPAYPPVYLPPPPGYVFGTALLTGLAFGAGVAITAGLWGWARPAWGGGYYGGGYHGGGYANVNVNRYNQINVNRTQINNNVWRAPPPQGMRAGVPPGGGPVGRPGGTVRPPNFAGGGGAGVRPPPGAPGGGYNRPPGAPGGGVNRPGGPGGQPGGRPPGTPNRPSVSVPGNTVRPPQGGANRPGNAGTNRPAGNTGANRPAGNPGANRPAGSPEANRPAGNPGANRPAGNPGANRPAGNPGANRPAGNPGANRPAGQPAGGQRERPNQQGQRQGAFGGMSQGRQASQASQRGAQSRQASAPRGGGGGGGGRRAGRG